MPPTTEYIAAREGAVESGGMSRDAAREIRVVRGRVVDEAGRAIAGVELNLYSTPPGGRGPRTWRRRTTSGDDGAFVFPASDDDASDLVVDALPRPEQPLRSSRTAARADVENVVALAHGAGVVVRVVDSDGAPLGGEAWRLWLDATLPDWPPHDRRREYEERLARLEAGTPEWDRFAALPESAGVVVPAGGRAAIGGLECGVYWVQLSRMTEERRKIVACEVSVESGAAEIVGGALVLNGAATIVVRATAAT